MSEESWLATKNIIPVVVAADTVWLAALTWWITTRFSELSCRVTKLEDENKTLKKRILSMGKQSILIKSITATLKDHDARLCGLTEIITETQSTSKQHQSNSTNGKQNKTQAKPQARKKEKSSTSSSSESESFEGSLSSEDLNSMYDELGNAPKKKKKRHS